MKLKLTEPRFLEFLKSMPETGMGYTVVTIVLKDGTKFPQALIGWDSIDKIRGHEIIPFTENDIDSMIITHDKW